MEEQKTSTTTPTFTISKHNTHIVDEKSHSISDPTNAISIISVDLNIFMNKLAKINPGPKMIGEVEYWGKSILSHYRVYG